MTISLRRELSLLEERPSARGYASRRQLVLGIRAVPAFSGQGAEGERFRLGQSLCTGFLLVDGEEAGGRAGGAGGGGVGLRGLFLGGGFLGGAEDVEDAGAGGGGGGEHGGGGAVGGGETGGRHVCGLGSSRLVLGCLWMG